MFKTIRYFFICLFLISITSCQYKLRDDLFLDYFKNPLEKYNPEDKEQRLGITQSMLNIENFIILLDNSQSMYEPYAGATKFAQAKKILSGFKTTLPNLHLNCAVRTFNDCNCTSTDKTELVFGITDYSEESFRNFIHSPEIFPVKSPLAKAIDATGEDLKSVFGNIAVIIISDGKIYDNSAISSILRLKTKYGKRLCVYTILIGNEPHGKSYMNKLALAGICGISRRADCLATKQCMHEFVKSVFLSKTRLTASMQKIDTDGDGIFDYMDLCPDTVTGLKVNSKGCPVDKDNDGVYDYMDRCPDTPSKSTVDKYGCASKDSDGDGIDDSTDQCPNTPVGIAVNSKGCSESDSDGDGISDSKDQCISTPKGAKVNEFGCWIVAGLHFELDRWDINDAYFSNLDEIIQILLDNPKLKVEIQGHTDDIGTVEHNKTLSDMRANAVMRHLIRRGIHPNRLTAIGYGNRRPLTMSKTPDGRVKNRRVEIRPIY